jgi:hypothetical protein
MPEPPFKVMLMLVFMPVEDVSAFVVTCIFESFFSQAFHIVEMLEQYTVKIFSCVTFMEVFLDLCSLDIFYSY